jgi:hypothetical protein
VDLILDHTNTLESDLDWHATLPTQPLGTATMHKFARGSAGPVNTGHRRHENSRISGKP